MICEANVDYKILCSMSCIGNLATTCKQTMITFVYLFIVFGLPGSFVTHLVYATDVTVDKCRATLQASSSRQARNHSVVKGSDNNDDLSAFDLTQDDADVIHLAGLDILDESKKLSMKMRHLSNEELRVTFIQVQLNHKVFHVNIM